MLIGFFGFYSKWIPWYEDKIAPWREVLKKKPPVDVDKEEEARLMANLWQPKEDSLLHVMKEAILSGPVLKRPDWERPFYVKTDWSSYAKGGALCQPECSVEAEEALRKQREEGTLADFDKTIRGLRLRPIQFISQRNTVAERSHHSSVGELGTGRWAFTKWRRHLWVKPFFWITDCSGIIKFWEMDLMPNHQCQRWKMDMLRYDFTATHRPEHMLNECNLLSRHNQHATALRRAEEKIVSNRDDRIETKLKRGVSPNKGAQKLAELDSGMVIPFGSASSFATMVKDFNGSLSSYEDRPGFSNQAVQCRGDTISRSFLAMVCDMDRFMGTVTPSGISLLAVAKQELNMGSPLVFESASKQAWIDKSNLLGPTKLGEKIMASGSSKEVDWAWLEIGLVPAKEMGTLRTVVTALKRNGCRMVILYWCFGFNRTEAQVEEWTSWCLEKHPDWKPSRHEVQNTLCGGPIRHTTHLLLLAPSEVIGCLGPFDDQEPSETMEQHLDDPNMRYSDYISGWTIISSWQMAMDHPVGLPAEELEIEWKGEQRKVFAALASAPDVANRSGRLEDYHFLVSVSDSGIRRAVRPVRDAELFRMYGFPEAFNKEALELSQAEKQMLFRDTIPKHALCRIMSVIQLAENKAMEIELEQYGKDIGEPGGSVDLRSYYYSARETGQARFSCATNRVINRWTTCPLPTRTEWQDASSQDPDVAYLIECIKTNKKVVLVKLTCKKYYLLWAKGQFQVEDDVLYQLEHPKGVKLRQLRRRVVPVSLRQVIYTAHHASPMAGHVGFYKTYWRIAARYYWPSMYEDVRKAVTQCGHCVLGNNVSHQAQQILGSLSTDEPFDIIAVDMWIPGVTLSKGSYVPDRSNVRNATLTSLCNLTAFATVAHLASMEGDVIAQVLMSQIVMPNGLPKLILLDDDSLFKHDLMTLLDDMGLPFHVVSAEQHEGILCERFHRHLNEAQRLMGLDTGDHSNWMINHSFAAYAWNAAPIDGTDIV